MHEILDPQQLIILPLELAMQAHDPHDLPTALFPELRQFYSELLLQVPFLVIVTGRQFGQSLLSFEDQRFGFLF